MKLSKIVGIGVAAAAKPEGTAQMVVRYPDYPARFLSLALARTCGVSLVSGKAPFLGQMKHRLS